jgi:hypothetical protein
VKTWGTVVGVLLKDWAARFRQEIEAAKNSAGRPFFIVF